VARRYTVIGYMVFFFVVIGHFGKRAIGVALVLPVVLEG